MAMQAQDTFLATLDDGTERLVTKGEVFPDGHELVKRDQAASKGNAGRAPLFKLLDLGEERPPKSEPKAAAAPKVTRTPGKAS